MEWGGWGEHRRIGDGEGGEETASGGRGSTLTHQTCPTPLPPLLSARARAKFVFISTTRLMPSCGRWRERMVGSPAVLSLIVEVGMGVGIRGVVMASAADDGGGGGENEGGGFGMAAEIL